MEQKCYTVNKSNKIEIARRVLFVFLFFLLISFSSAIKISPTQTYISMDQYETNCTNVWILPIENYTISSKWSFDGMGDLNKYNLTKDKIKLNINYTYISEGKYELCFTPNRAGNLSGIVYFYSEKNMVEIGTWIDLKVNEVGTIERVSLITANAIKENNINEMNILLSVVFILLLFILFLIIRRSLRFNSLKNEHT